MTQKSMKSTQFKTMGASNHVLHERAPHDYYATEPRAAELLMQMEYFNDRIWECACGEGHLSKVFEKFGHDVKSTDLIDRGYGEGAFDFLSEDNKFWDGDIITNPPYKHAHRFILKALDIIPEGNKVAMFLKVQFLEGQFRKALFTRQPPLRIHVSSSRLQCAINGDFEALKQSGGSAMAYAWFVWQKGFRGDTTVKWFN